MVIGVVNQKGGTGKSTIATNLAAHLACQGKHVLLVDADPQATALDWAAVRNGTEPHVSVIGLPIRNLHEEIKVLRDKYDLIIIDGGGRITESARAAVAVADFIIVPTRPSQPDVASTQGFFEQVVREVAAIKGEVKGAILVTMSKRGTVIGQKSEDYLQGLGYPVFDIVLHDSVAYQEALARGLSVVEHDRTHKAAQEMEAFVAELIEVIQ
jgi:chromosome partitioning protein